MYNKNALLKRKILNRIQNNEYGQYVVKLFNRHTSYYFNIVIEYYPEIDHNTVYERIDILEHETTEFIGNYEILKITDLQEVL